MIYLQYIFQQFGLTSPASIALDMQDTDSIRQEVMEEFVAAFAGCQVIFAPAQAEWLILVYRRAAIDLQEKLSWGRKNLAKGSLGVGFFCVDDREFELVARAAYVAWARRESWIALLAGLMGANFAGKFFFRLVDRMLWLKESF